MIMKLLLNSAGMQNTTRSQTISHPSILLWQRFQYRMSCDLLTNIKCLGAFEKCESVLKNCTKQSRLWLAFGEDTAQLLNSLVPRHLHIRRYYSWPWKSSSMFNKCGNTNPHPPKPDPDFSLCQALFFSKWVWKVSLKFQLQLSKS